MKKYVVIYEESFEELLYTIYYLIQKKITPLEIHPENSYTIGLFDVPFKIKKTDFDIYLYWQEKVGKNILLIAKDVYLSSSLKKELILYYFFLNALKYPNTILQRRNLKCVNEVLNITHAVHRELHKMKGFLRFQEMENGFFYAPIETKHFILFSLAAHFQKRMLNEHFVIHDQKRGVYAFYDTKKMCFFKEEDVKSFSFCPTEKEKEMKSLWKTFFQAISILERENKKCQRNFMPKRYWKYLTEMEEEK